MPNCKLNFHVKYAKLNEIFGSIVDKDYDKELVNLIYTLVWLRKECYDKPMKSSPL